MHENFGVRIKWLGCACFELDFGGLTVVNDPWITPNEATELDFDDVKIKALCGRHVPLPGTASERAYNRANSPINAGDPNLIELSFLGDLEYRNFLYTMPNGTKLLIWGNKLRPEQRNILRREKPDIAILQVTGKNSAEETAELMKEIGCKVVLPHHFDFPKSRAKFVVELGEVMAKLAPEIRFIVPEYGQWIEL